METYEESQKRMKRMSMLMPAIIICVPLLLTIIFGSYYTVPVGERVIITQLGRPIENIYTPGFHFKIPIIQKVNRMIVRTQTIEFDNKLATGTDSEYSSLFLISKDLQEVSVATVVNYHISDDNVMNVFVKYKDMNTYTTTILEPIVRDSIKTIATQYTAEEIADKRVEFSDKVFNAIQEKFNSKYAALDGVSLTNTEFTKEYADSISRKVVAIQDAQAAKNKLEQIKYEAEQRIAKATAEAEAIKIQTQAIQSQGGKDYVQLQAIAKWDGKLPQFTGGAMPFINIQSNQS